MIVESQERFFNGLKLAAFVLLVFVLQLLPCCDGVRQLQVARERGTRPGTFFYHIRDGYHYHRNAMREGILYFKCVRYERGCRGRARFDRVEGFVHTNRHNEHHVDPHYPDEMALRRNILRRCRDLDYAPFRRIIAEESRWFPPEVVSRVVYSRMRTSMRNARMTNFPNQPATLLELTQILLNQQYHVLTMTEDGEDNIYGGSVTDIDGGHHVVFTSNRMVQRMRLFRVLQSDGTFKAVPIGPHFADQVFCIVSVWRHHVLPLAWVLMSSRTQVAYTSVLQLLQEHMGPNIELTRVISDFETAQQNAWQQVFRIAIQGCLWHLCRAYMRQVADMNLLVRMRRVGEVRRIIRLTLALPLLPEDLIVAGYRIILLEARNEGNFIFRIVLPYLTYVWRYWVSRPWRRSRMSVFGSPQRTNNACESHNRVLREAVGIHPNIFLFILGHVSLEQQSNNMILALEEGRRVARGRRATSVFNDARVEQLSLDLFNPPGPIDQSIYRFLRVASHLMDNMVEEIMEHRL